MKCIQTWDLDIDMFAQIQEDARKYSEEGTYERFLVEVIRGTTTADAFPLEAMSASNIVESVNSSWLDIRNLPIHAALQSICNSMMKKFYIRRNRI